MLRNFALGALKEFGLGAPFEPRRLLDNAVSNVICSMIFGNRYGNEDMEFLRLLDLFNDNFRIMSSRKADVPGCRPGPNLTSILLWFCLLPVGSHSDTDLAPQCPSLGKVPPALQLRLVTC
uniref:Uncharacterized protein n=1 Tax=Rangifer tarandus platyrhynchus TaxID=3082113 RepID=A0ACB0EAX5_RANTA|nr:unnamed protein product [Rangifer tarandus platyrhynchus]